VPALTGSLFQTATADARGSERSHYASPGGPALASQERQPPLGLSTLSPRQCGVGDSPGPDALAHDASSRACYEMDSLGSLRPGVSKPLASVLDSAAHEAAQEIASQEMPASSFKRPASISSSNAPHRSTRPSSVTFANDASADSPPPPRVRAAAANAGASHEAPAAAAPPAGATKRMGFFARFAHWLATRKARKAQKKRDAQLASAAAKKQRADKVAKAANSATSANVSARV
jgi:hypothetical protein